MNKVFVLAPNESWIVDRFVKEWTEDNGDITISSPFDADVVWIFADWAWRQLSEIGALYNKKVITTIHHIVPEKFGPRERIDFQFRDDVTTVYHVPNIHTYDFIRPLTTKPIHMIGYWANQHIWKPTGTREELRKKHGLPLDVYLIGSFQRDTEGRDLISPKLEKGPDLLADAIIKYRDRCVDYFDIEVVLAGWRRQYIMKRLDDAKIKYYYFEKPEQQVINELYQTLNLYPVTSRYEGGPQSLIEAGLLGIPAVSRDIGIASHVLFPSSIADDVTTAAPEVPRVEAMKLPMGYEPYRELIKSL
jgi:glycosyltransferase involved in cell wall biosynthesis